MISTVSHQDVMIYFIVYTKSGIMTSDIFQDFPFFRQHKQTKGTITMENGDMAAVCLDCFENLKNQFMEVSVHCTHVQ